MPYKQLGIICTGDESVANLVKFLRKLNFQIKALWCADYELGLETAAENFVPFLANKPDEVLLRKEVELVIVIGRPALHSQICVKALGVGKHVLCAAPAALSLPDANKMLQAAQYYPQILSLVGFGLRQLEVFSQMRGRILQHFIGRPLCCQVTVTCSPLFDKDQFDWRWERAVGGGLLNLVGAPIIDLLAFLLEKKATRAQGLVHAADQPHHSSNSPGEVSNGFRRLDVDNFASFLLKIQGGISATVTLNSIRPGQFEQTVSVCGTEGMLVARNSKLTGSRNDETEEKVLFDAREQTISSHKMSAESLAAAEFAASFSGGPLEFYRHGFGRLLRAVSAAIPHYNSSLERSGASWREFVPHLSTVASFQDAQYVAAVIEAVRHSSDFGEWVKVDFAAEEEASVC